MKTAKKSNRPWHGFVNLNLNKKQKDDIKSMAADLTAVNDTLELATNSGCKVAVTWDAFNDCYLATIYGHNHVENEGYAMTGRANSIWVAMASVLYKHQIVFKGGSWEKQTVMDFID